VRILACSLLVAAAACAGDADVPATTDSDAGDGVPSDSGRPNDAPQPSFVFFISDDQRFDTTGEAQRRLGDQGLYPWMRDSTPSIDRLAAEGVTFTNAFVVQSLCSPSRAAMLTGQYNHANTVVHNHIPFPSDAVTHASVLRAAGWVTGYFGKWHMGDQRARPGFDHAASFIGNGVYFDETFVVDGADTPVTGYTDDRTTDFAIDFIRDNAHRPFVAIVAFKAPHSPYSVPPRLSDRFSDVGFVTPPNATPIAPWYTTGHQMPDESFRSYFRAIAGVDENVGRVLAVLDELGLRDDTAVVFTADNGYMLGSHGHIAKRAAYEESMRVPLYFRYPRLGVEGARVDARVLNIDLAPTLLEIARRDVPSSMQGRSWLSTISDATGGSGSERARFLYENFRDPTDGPLDVPPIVALRAAGAKIVTYPRHADWLELFDLETDPLERRNLARDTAYMDLLARMQTALEAERAATGYSAP